MAEVKQDPTEVCWLTGQYSDQCICLMCMHKDECSGSDASDYYDDEEDE